MKNTSYIFAFILLISLALVHCGAEEKKVEKKGESKPSVTNPNGMSEMALLMEKMSQTFFQLKDSIQHNQNFSGISPVAHFNTISSAKTTKQNVINDAYLAYANSFLTSYEILLESTPQDRVKEFNRAVTACKNCHQDICPGPLARINKLFIPEN